jgi:multisubunit Na+/H+ antiporter MnhC subunit
MATPSFITPASAPFPSPAWLMERVKPFLAPYYLTVAAVLGAITVGFAVVTVLLVLVATNFNVLGWME